MNNYVITGILYLLGTVIFIKHNFNGMIELAKEYKEIPLLIVAIVYWILCLLWPIFIISDMFKVVIKKLGKKNN